MRLSHGNGLGRPMVACEDECSLSSLWTYAVALVIGHRRSVVLPRPGTGRLSSCAHGHGAMPQTADGILRKLDGFLSGCASAQLVEKLVFCHFKLSHDGGSSPMNSLRLLKICSLSTVVSSTLARR